MPRMASKLSASEFTPTPPVVYLCFGIFQVPISPLGNINLDLTSRVTSGGIARVARG